jgi:hypothetical protein
MAAGLVVGGIEEALPVSIVISDVTLTEIPSPSVLKPSTSQLRRLFTNTSAAWSAVGQCRCKCKLVN